MVGPEVPPAPTSLSRSHCLTMNLSSSPHEAKPRLLLFFLRPPHVELEQENRSSSFFSSPSSSSSSSSSSSFSVLLVGSVLAGARGPFIHPSSLASRPPFHAHILVFVLLVVLFSTSSRSNEERNPSTCLGKQTSSLTFSRSSYLYVRSWDLGGCTFRG